MTDIPAEPQGRQPDRREPEPDPAPASPHNPGGLMPDLRGKAAAQGRDPEEVDPLALDEDQLRHLSGYPDRKLP